MESSSRPVARSCWKALKRSKSAHGVQRLIYDEVYLMRGVSKGFDTEREREGSSNCNLFY